MKFLFDLYTFFPYAIWRHSLKNIRRKITYIFLKFVCIDFSLANCDCLIRLLQTSENLSWLNCYLDLSKCQQLKKELRIFETSKIMGDKMCRIFLSFTYYYTLNCCGSIDRRWYEKKPEKLRAFRAVGYLYSDGSNCTRN